MPGAGYAGYAGGAGARGVCVTAPRRFFGLHELLLDRRQIERRRGGGRGGGGVRLGLGGVRQREELREGVGVAILQDLHAQRQPVRSKRGISGHGGSGRLQRRVTAPNMRSFVAHGSSSGAAAGEVLSSAITGTKLVSAVSHVAPLRDKAT